MRIISKGSIAKGLLAVVAGASAVFLAGSPAMAADDSFKAYNADACAMVEFVDYGPGAPGNPANNDDYLVIHDYCGDGYPTRAYAWLNGSYYGSKDNRNSAAGAPVYWDPWGNVVGGDYMQIQSCLINGSGTAFRCSGIIGKTSSDG